MMGRAQNVRDSLFNGSMRHSDALLKIFRPIIYSWKNMTV
jgi:hypothetical protein